MARSRSLAPIAHALTACACLSALPLGAQTKAATPPPPAASAEAQSKAEVPVRTVMLFSSGVGYFEHTGMVRGSGSTELRFKTSQINDILKSLVLSDEGGGRVTGVTYPSQNPIERTLASFSVDIRSDPSVADLLDQLRGARVSVTNKGERVAGTILGVETHRVFTNASASQDSRVLNVLSGGTVRSVELGTATSVTLEDAELQSELSKALVALSQSRDNERKPVTVTYAGTGERRLRLGYVVETPVWKTSYRLLLDKKESRVQGWAIVENQTETDWRDVQLSLVSGRPTSFTMDLYRPLYNTRPVVVQESFAGLRPQIYQGGVAAAATALSAEAEARRTESPNSFGRGVAGGRVELPNNSLDLPTPSAAGVTRMNQVVPLARVEQLGELFHYTVDNVTLARQKSAMLPIVNDTVNTERVSIYNRAVLARNPLFGVRLRNTSGKHLMAGPVTVFDGGGYAGDARVDDVPPGQSRLLSFGVDLDVVVDPGPVDERRSIVTGKIANGWLRLVRRAQAKVEYVIENRSDAEKSVVLEHPHSGDSKLVGVTALESTPTLHRLLVKVPAHQTIHFPVAEEYTSEEERLLVNESSTSLIAYGTQTELPAAVRQAIARVAEYRRIITEADQRITDRTRQISDLTEEQGRIRENMKTVGNGSAYAQRLLAKLNEQESQIETLQKERAEATAKRDTTRREMEEFVRGVRIE